VAQNSIPAPSDAQGVIFASTNRPLIETGAHTQHLSSPMTSQVSFASGNAFAENKHNPKIAMYAAGIAIMFLLFSANGAGGSLLEEKEAGTLERILGSRLSISQLFIGKWLYITGMGVLQLVIMFAWGQLVFGIDFTGHLAGFALLALPTSGAAASFALLLAALCKSRSQLNGVSVVLVLSMSALGGSMIPRYIMSESMQRLGRLTFNGWALDGFQKIFWYDLPVSAVRLEVCVLCCIAGVLGIAARLLATRWSTL
jgi:ABC-2 type transport system permease protein